MYYSGTQATAWVASKKGSRRLTLFELDVASFQFNASVVKMPLYGYRSKTFDAVAVGEKLIQGQMMINFKEADQLELLEEEITFELTLRYWHGVDLHLAQYIFEDVHFSTLSHGATPTGNPIIEAVDFIAKDFRAKTTARPPIAIPEDETSVGEDSLGGVPPPEDIPLDVFVDKIKAEAYQLIVGSISTHDRFYIPYSSITRNSPLLTSYITDYTVKAGDLVCCRPSCGVETRGGDFRITVGSRVKPRWAFQIKQAVEASISPEGTSSYIGPFSSKEAAESFYEFYPIFGNGMWIWGTRDGPMVIIKGNTRFPDFVVFKDSQEESLGVISNQLGEIMYINSDDIDDLLHNRTTKVEILNHLFAHLVQS